MDKIIEMLEFLLFSNKNYKIDQEQINFAGGIHLDGSDDAAVTNDLDV